MKDFYKRINRERVENEYWIDRSGKIHRYEGDLNVEICSMHSEIARNLYPESNRPTDVLFNLGWIMVGSTVYTNPIIHKKPTARQLRMIENKNLTFPHNGYYISYYDNADLLEEF